MKIYRVEFSRRADRQLEKLYIFLAKKAGERIALQYVQRIIAFCMDLRTFPNRGTVRPELGEGVRVIGFEYRVGVQFRVRKDRVQILNVSYSGEAYEWLFELRGTQ